MMTLGSAIAKAETSLTLVPGSTIKLEQLIGDFDKQRRVETLSRTLSHYGIVGTDLGCSFEHRGKLHFLFGDTIGPTGGDVIATTDATDPEAGLRLDFLTGSDSRYLKIEPPGIRMGGYEVPSCGISLDGKMYVAVRTNYSPDNPTDKAVLTRYDGNGTFIPLRTISHLPEGKFIGLAMREEPEPTAGLPPGGPYILVWSSAVYRQSNAYLSIVPRATFETGEGTKYFAGVGSDGNPMWSEHETDAAPVVEHPVLGEFSVTWSKDLRLWLMAYDSGRLKGPRQVLLRYASTPWGPWSDGAAIFDIERDNGAAFIHKADREDGLAGPVIAAGNPPPETVNGGIYAPYVIERFTKLDRQKLSLYYLMSTWNPYTVVLMKSEFDVRVPEVASTGAVIR